MEAKITSDGCNYIAEHVIQNTKGNVLIMTDRTQCMLQSLFLHLANNSIAYKRIVNGIEYSGGNKRTIEVVEYTMSTWGIYVDDDIECLYIDKADIINDRVLERILADQKCKVFMTTKTRIAIDNVIFIQ